MPHMVIFRTNEGKQAYHPTEALEDAVRFVEHLRNAEQVTEVHVFRMQEVPLEFKVLYKVEVGGAGESEPAAPAPAPPPPARVTAPADESFAPAPGGTGARMNESRGSTAEQPSETLTESQQGGGRFGLFSRS